MITTPSTDVENIGGVITIFLRRYAPQIKMHGGAFTIDGVNLDEARVTITLTGPLLRLWKLTDDNSGD